MQTSPLKIIGFTLIAAALTSGTALAGNGKNCDHKKDHAVKTEAAMKANTNTSVLSTSATAATMSKSDMKVLSFDDALKKCQAKQAKDLQACIDYKTGKTKPAS